MTTTEETKDPFVFITKNGHKQIKNKNGFVLMSCNKTTTLLLFYFAAAKKIS